MRRVLVLVLFAMTASAHVPAFDEAGSSAATAFFVDDPTKSWVFYQEGASGQRWYQFELDQGESLVASLSLPPDEVARPHLWIVGPGLTGPGPVGSPAGLGALRVPTEDDVAIEPFSPLAMRSTASWRGDAPAAGTFYVVVESAAPATYAVAIGGRESFTPVEWVGIPVERAAIQQWGGVPWFVAGLGEVLGLAAAGAWIWRRRPGLRIGVGVAGAGAMAGTAVTTLTLATIAAVKAGPSGALVIPVVFALIALGIGFGAYRATQGTKRWTGAAWGAAGLLAWAGLLVGPALMFLWAAWRVR